MRLKHEVFFVFCFLFVGGGECECHAGCEAGLVFEVSEV